MSLLDDLRTLDPKQPGNWPWLVKAGAFVAIFIIIQVAAYFIFWQGQTEEIEKGRSDVDKLKEAFLEKKKLAVNLEAYKQQRVEIEQSFGALLKQLPNKSEMDALLIDINQAGLGRGLAFDLFKPAEKENFTEFYAGLKRSKARPRPRPAWLMSISSASISLLLGSCFSSAPKDCSISTRCCL